MMSINPKTSVIAVLSITLILVAGAIFVLYNQAKDSAQLPQSTTFGDQAMLNASLVRLTQADSSRERLQAARWLGEQSASVNSRLVQTLAQSLTEDTDPTIRSAVANTFGELVSKHTHGSSALSPQEPQMISLLSAAYDHESNASVRRCIATAAGEFNHPNAARLLNKALVDQDPSVREAAQEAKLKRQRRQLATHSG